MTLWRNLVVALVAAFALAACSSSSDNGTDTGMTEPPTTVEPEPTPAERQMTLIESAQSGLETALSGLDADNPTAGQIAAVTTAMNLLRDALAGANDLSPNQTQDARDDLAAAMTTAREAQATLSTGMATDRRIEMQMMLISDAEEALDEALEGDEIADLGAANAAYAALQAAINGGRDLTDAQKADAVTALNAADVTIANAEIAMYEARAMADGATLTQMLAAYQGKLMAAQRLRDAAAASPADLAKAHTTIGAAETKIAQLNEDIQEEADEQDDKTRLASNAASMKVAEAINAHTLTEIADLPPEFVHPDPNAAANDPDQELGISRGSSAAKITPYQSATERVTKKFTEGTAQDAGTGWSGATFTRPGTSSKRSYTEMATVYTDIEVAKDQLWATTFSAAADGIGAAGDGGAVEIGTAAELDATRLAGAILPNAPSGDDDNSEREIAANGSLPGSLYGVSGRFSCGAATCTVTRDDEGKVTVDNAVTFTPSSYNAALTMAKYAVSDTEYTHFGYWMKSTKQRDGTDEHDIKTFHGGNAAGTLATFDATAVTGTASYYGAAAGVYVKKEGSGDDLVVTDGYFTAEAELTANFGGSEIAVDDHNTVSGTISNFTDRGTDLGFADLTLGGMDADGGAKFDDTGNGAELANGLFAGETDGGGTSGHWSGQFYGNAGAGTTTDTTDDYPVNVSGQFNGHFVNGHVAGAFGAEYDD